MEGWRLRGQCVLAFNGRDREEAVRLLHLQNPDVPHQYGCNLLYYSIRNGWLDVTRDLITNYHFNPHENSSYGESCLYTAARGNHVDIVEYLINECGCDPMMGTATRHGSVPLLHYVASEGLLDFLKCMVMNINGHIMDGQYRDTNGRTVLHYAIKHIDVVKYLINECNFDIMITDKDGVPFLHYVASEGLLDVLKCMVININGHIMDEQYRDTNGQTVLHCAVQHIDVLKYLINECNCDIMTPDKYGRTILHVTANEGLLDVMKYLINTHHYPMTTNNSGQIGAVKHIDVVKYLINECNFDIMITVKDGVPFLHYVASEGLLDVLKCMVMNINGHIMDEQYRDTNGQTVLHCAVQHIDVVKYLINECNCDIMTPDKYGRTILHVTANEGLLDVMKYLINTHHYPMTTNNSGQIGAVKHIDVVKYLINECNFDIMITVKDGVPFLHYVASEGLLDVLKCMVMNINGHIMDEQYRDTNGQTVLHCAVQHIDVVKYLINECNCDIMTPDKYGRTILHVTANEGLLDVMKYLINTHHYPMTTNNSGQIGAVKHIDVVKYLINECNFDIMITDKDGVLFFIM